MPSLHNQANLRDSDKVTDRSVIEQSDRMLCRTPHRSNARIECSDRMLGSNARIGCSDRALDEVTDRSVIERLLGTELDNFAEPDSTHLLHLFAAGELNQAMHVHMTTTI